LPLQDLCPLSSGQSIDDLKTVISVS